QLVRLGLCAFPGRYTSLWHTSQFPVTPHIVHNARGARFPDCIIRTEAHLATQIKNSTAVLAYAVSCDQAFALCRLFCVRVCPFARPEARLAAIAGPHASADMAQNSTGRAVRAAA